MTEKVRCALLGVLFFIVSPSYALPNKQELQNAVANLPEAENTMIFVHVLFRHGQRTPTPVSTYFNDPNKYASYWPYGIGGLTNKGMLDVYKAGLELRRRYGRFLGEIYFPDLIGALSSPKTRCQASLQCILAAMFPPAEDDLFLADLNWRPIVYDILPADKDDTFAVYDCENYWNITSHVTNETILSLYDYVSFHSGNNIRNNSGLFTILDAIRAQTEFGIRQPSWVDSIYPEPLASSALVPTYYDLIEQRLQLGASGFYRRLTTSTLDKLSGNLSPPRRKMLLYSGHDQNLVYALSGIKAYDGQVPNMASYLAFELHHINGTYGFKVFLQNYDEVAPVPINVLGQGVFCPLEKFVDGVRWLSEMRKPICYLG